MIVGRVGNLTYQEWFKKADNRKAGHSSGQVAPSKIPILVMKPCVAPLTVSSPGAGTAPTATGCGKLSSGSRRDERLSLKQARKEVAGQGGQPGRGAVDGAGAAMDFLLCDATDIEALLDAIPYFRNAAVDALAFAVCLLFKLVYGR